MGVKVFFRLLLSSTDSKMNSSKELTFFAINETKHLLIIFNSLPVLHLSVLFIQLQQQQQQNQ